MRFGGRQRPVVEVAKGESVLAWAPTEDGPLAGTRDALYLPGDVRIPWHEVEHVDWDLETSVLTVREVGTFGRERPEHLLTVLEPGKLLALVRERVTSSIVLTRWVQLDERRGAKVIGRRPTSGARTVAWFVEYDAGLDPADAFVDIAVQNALAGARAEVGDA